MQAQYLCIFPGVYAGFLDGMRDCAFFIRCLSIINKGPFPGKLIKHFQKEGHYENQYHCFDGFIIGGIDVRAGIFTQKQ